jgi:hypothetical protein
MRDEQVLAKVNRPAENAEDHEEAVCVERKSPAEPPAGNRCGIGDGNTALYALSWSEQPSTRYLVPRQELDP